MLRNREFIRTYKKDKKCEMCGYNKYTEILDFHHINKETKTDTVSNLVCPNCHREIHIKEGNWGKHGRE